MHLLRPSLLLARRAAPFSIPALAALALAPQAAPAAVSCDYHGAVKIVEITLTASGDLASVKRNLDGTIAVNSAPCTGAAGTATVSNTDGVYVSDVSGLDTTVDLDTTDGPFGPGATSEANGGASEIEFQVDLGAGQWDSLRVWGEQAGAQIAFGSDGINLNVGAEPAGTDLDVSSAGVDQTVLFGSPVGDKATGQGGEGTGQPFTRRLQLIGKGGDDELIGAEATDSMLFGGTGDDVLVGGDQMDYLEGGLGDDEVIGGGGWDNASYLNSPHGVSVDLSVAGPQDTLGDGVDAIAGIESLVGSGHDDVLRGDGDDNFINGRAGDDVIDARAGEDSLFGGDGADTLRGGPGDDYHNGGADADAVAYDDAATPVEVDLNVAGVAQPTGGSGAETLIDIEDVIGSPFGDRLTGSADSNLLDGGAGADEMDGREGADTLRGGDGQDAIDSVDGSADSVGCGEGPDSLTTDALDSIAPDCTPDPDPTPTPTPTPIPTPTSGSGFTTAAGTTAAGTTASGAGGGLAPTLALSVPRQSLRSVRKRGLRVTLSCSLTCRASGRVIADRRTARRLDLGTTTAMRTLGRLAPVALTSGSPRTAHVLLTRAARRALRHTRSARLVVRARAVDDAGHAGATARTVVRLRRDV